MFEVNDYTEVSASSEHSIYITCSREDVAELFKWLNSVNTGPMNDQQFMYFCSFKDKLQNVVLTSDEALKKLREKLEEKQCDATKHVYRCIKNLGHVGMHESYTVNDEARFW